MNITETITVNTDGRAGWGRKTNMDFFENVVNGISEQTKLDPSVDDFYIVSVDVVESTKGVTGRTRMIVEVEIDWIERGDVQ